MALGEMRAAVGKSDFAFRGWMQNRFVSLAADAFVCARPGHPFLSRHEFSGFQIWTKPSSPPKAAGMREGHRGGLGVPDTEQSWVNRGRPCWSASSVEARLSLVIFYFKKCSQNNCDSVPSKRSIGHCYREIRGREVIK